MTGPRKAFAGFSEMAADRMAGLQQFSQMAVYWGRCSCSLDAQVRALLVDRKSHELIEVTNEDMNAMRQVSLTGIPVYFSRYADGVTKMYPIPETAAEVADDRK